MADDTTNPALDETLRFSIPVSAAVWVGVATIVLVIVAVFSDWWDFLKVFLVFDGPVLGILIARRAGWSGIVSTVVAGSIGGSLALGIFVFLCVLFPPPQEPGVVAWGGRQIGAAIYLSFMAGLFGGFCGGFVGLVAGITGWLIRKSRTSRA